MAYKTKELETKSLDILSSNQMLTSVEELVLRLPCSKKTFYEHKLHEQQDIKEGLENNKIQVKAHLRDKWFRSDNATLQMGLYKLLATEQEYQRLSNIKYEITNNIEKVENIETLKTEIRELVKQNGFN